MKFKLGDVVLVPRGQSSRLFEINKIEEGKIWVTNGHIQVTKTEDELELICGAENRKDKKIPNTKWFK